MGAIEQSKALAYVLQKGWAHRVTETEIIVEYCPISGCDGWHWYQNIQSGLWQCHKCGESGNLYQLREHQGDRMENTMSMKDVANAARQPGVLPNVDAAHQRLLSEAEGEALDYLVGERGYSMKLIERFKLGVVEEFGKKWLLIPFFHKENLVYAKYRSLPPAAKEFRGISGREAPLFNQDAITNGMEELLFVEGEGDALACVDHGIEAVVGVPGANVKKAIWIKRLDDAAPKRIYLCYDNDKVGQDAAKEIAGRIGLNKCFNIVLPAFEKKEGGSGKDIGEWFHAGHTAEEFGQLKTEAKPFSVDGIYSAQEVIEEIRQDLTKGPIKPQYVYRYPEINHIAGGFSDGMLIGIMAEGKVGKTTWAINLLDQAVEDYGQTGLMFCQEMSPKQNVMKWMAYKTDTEQDKITLETVDNALGAVANYQGDLLFGFTKDTKYTEVFETIRQAVRRYGIKFAVFDNLQLLCRNIDHATQEVNTICRGFKNLAMELGIVIFLIIQPHRVREGEIVAARNANGSAEIEKIVDCMFCLHRNREGKIKQEDFEAAAGFFEAETNFQPQLLVRADLTRFAGGGATTLWMDGAKSKVTSFPKDIAAMAKSVSLAPQEQIEA